MRLAVDEGRRRPVPEDRVRVMAAPADQALAEAALRAARRRRRAWTTGDRRLLLVWEGAVGSRRACVRRGRRSHGGTESTFDGGVAPPGMRSIARPRAIESSNPYLIPREQLAVVVAACQDRRRRRQSRRTKAIALALGRGTRAARARARPPTRAGDGNGPTPPDSGGARCLTRYRGATRGPRRDCGWRPIAHA